MVFTIMNYQKIYNQLINRARTRTLQGYHERHHVVPKCMGGTEDLDNLVDLTAREHYIAHKLLWKIYPNHHGIIKAFWMMLNKVQSNTQTRTYHVSSNEYQIIRELNSKIQLERQRNYIKQNGSPFAGSFWITNGILNKKVYDKTDIPVGWQRGRIQSGKSPSEKCKEYIWIKNGVISKKHHILEPIPAGWVRGRYNKPTDNPRYDKPVSDVTKQKQRFAKIGLYDGDKNPMYGKKHKQESIEKMKTVKKYGK
jgi:hypothetical protein